MKPEQSSNPTRGLAALVLRDRRIAGVKKPQTNNSLLEAARKVVVATANWYEQQNQAQVKASDKQ